MTKFGNHTSPSRGYLPADQLTDEKKKIIILFCKCGGSWEDLPANLAILGAAGHGLEQLTLLQPSEQLRSEGQGLLSDVHILP